MYCRRSLGFSEPAVTPPSSEDLRGTAPPRHGHRYAVAFQWSLSSQGVSTRLSRWSTGPTANRCEPRETNSKGFRLCAEGHALDGYGVQTNKMKNITFCHQGQSFCYDLKLRPQHRQHTWRCQVGVDASAQSWGVAMFMLLRSAT